LNKDYFEDKDNKSEIEFLIRELEDALDGSEPWENNDKFKAILLDNKSLFKKLDIDEEDGGSKKEFKSGEKKDLNELKKIISAMLESEGIGAINEIYSKKESDEDEKEKLRTINSILNNIKEALRTIGASLSNFKKADSEFKKNIKERLINHIKEIKKLNTKDKKSVLLLFLSDLRTTLEEIKKQIKDEDED